MPARRTVLHTLILFLAAACLYGTFLGNPFVFDDLPYLYGGLAHYAAGEQPFGIRWLPYMSLGILFPYAGTDPFWYRLGNLALHTATAITLYFLTRRLLANALPDLAAARLGALSLIAALLFALHPAAVHAVGYLIQRSIVMATLFTLLMWLCLLVSLDNGRRRWLLASVLCYFLAVFSKEHAIMAPAAALALIILHARTHAGTALLGNARLWLTFTAYAVIAAYVLYMKGHVVGSVYEANAVITLGEMQTAEPGLRPEHPYLLSVLTQCLLYFKYLALWVIPDVTRMSIDMREPFATSLASWLHLAGAALYISGILAGMALLWQGGARGLIGFVLLAPALMFMTELSTVRLQELFVLYRSYLWMPPVVLLPSLLLARAEWKTIWLAGWLLGAVFAGLSYERLMTFSHPLLLWDEAARLTEGRDHLPGTARTLYIRGYYFNKYGFRERAIADFDHALKLNPVYPAAYKERGRAYLSLGEYQLALQDFNRALAQQPGYGQAYMGRAKVLEALGETKQARQDYALACQYDWKEACDKLK